MKDLHLLSSIHPIQCSPIIRGLAVVPIPTRIHPRRVHRLDQGKLFGASPALQFLLARHGILNELEILEPHQAITVVTRREAIAFLPFVLKHALVQITGHADIERGLRLPMMYVQYDPSCMPLS